MTPATLSEIWRSTSGWSGYAVRPTSCCRPISKSLWTCYCWIALWKYIYSFFLIKRLGVFTHKISSFGYCAQKRRARKGSNNILEAGAHMLHNFPALFGAVPSMTTLATI